MEICFKRSKDPLDALKIGQWALPFKDKDKIKVIKSLGFIKIGDIYIYNKMFDCFRIEIETKSTRLLFIRKEWVLNNKKIFKRIK